MVSFGKMLLAARLEWCKSVSIRSFCSVRLYCACLVKVVCVVSIVVEIYWEESVLSQSVKQTFD